ncbi:head-to-tail adaptor [Microbacterium phage Floof]|uniref:Head-to-tail adaptor n=1 Tax=Microbacterium phage Floof TaxID=2201433 RepID=A0A2Z4Q4G4_9CAUD|nr:head-to-tail adaptor [Microbacterium phage Floof]
MNTPLPPSLEDLALRMGLEDIDLDEGDARARLKAALDDATALVLSEVSPKLAERWSAAAPVTVHIVIRSAARRAYENPRGIQQETFGDHTVGMTDTSGVFLTARELAIIRKVATGRAGSFIGSLRTPSAYGDGS